MILDRSPFLATLEKIAIIAYIFILAEAFKPMIFPIWQPLRMGLFAIVGGLFVLNLPRATLGIFRTPILYILCGYAIISYLWSESPSDTFTRSIALVASMLFAAYFATRYTERQRLQVLGLAAIIFIVMTYIFVFAIPGQGLQGEGIWRGIFAQKNPMGRAMIICALVALTYSSESLWMNMLRVVGYFLALIAIVQSDSMTSILLITIITAAAFSLRALWLKTVPAIALAFATIVPTLVVVFIAVTVDTDEILIALGRNPTLTGRTDIWERVLWAIDQRPWSGYGYGGFWDNWGGTFGILWSPYETWIPGSAHNTYYNTLVELGYPGLILFIITAVFLVPKAIIHVAKKQTTESMFPILLVIYLLILGFSEDFILFTKLEWALYMTVAIALSVREVVPKRATDDNYRVSQLLYPVPPPPRGSLT